MKTDIRKGLKFTSNTFAMNAEISAIREDQNQVDVILTPSDGFAWEEKNWNLQYVKWAFERGDYMVTDSTKEISVGI